MSYLHIDLYATLGISQKEQVCGVEKLGLILSSATYLRYSSYFVIGGKVEMERQI